MALALKLEQLTVRLGGQRRGGETIVLARPGDPIDEAFRIARDLGTLGIAVRMIGPGVTLERAWPEWVKDAPALALTEWGALQWGSLAETTAGLQEEMRAWIRSVAQGAFDPGDADRILFAAACSRFFQPVVSAFPVARALAWAFPGSDVRLTRSDEWLPALAHQAGAPRFRPHGSGSRIAGSVWRVRVAALGVVALVAAVAMETAAYLKATTAFRTLARLRRTAPSSVPDTWVGMVPDWYRINHHLLDALALPETEGAGSMGVLLVATLATGLRDEARMRSHGTSDHLWPGLGDLAERLPRCVVEQAVVPESPRGFLRATARGVSRSVKVLWQLSASPSLRLPSVEISHSSWWRQLVTWATIDVLRATLAEAAARSLVAGVTFEGKTLSLIGSNLPNIAAVDLVLQQAGATTLDHAHGFRPDGWSAHAASSSSIRCVWTAVERSTAAVPGERTLVTGMPVRIRLGPRTRRPRRVLIVSNYVHRDDRLPNGRHPFLIFQEELLAVETFARSRGGDDLIFRWRPHPADDESIVALELAKHPGLELSRGVQLDVDVAWADIIVSSISTVVIEVLFAGVPVFVQVLPEYTGIHSTSFIDPARSFFRAQDGADLLGAWLQRCSSDPASGLAEERRARLALFGPSGEPIPMTDYIGRSRRRPLPGS